MWNPIILKWDWKINQHISKLGSKQILEWFAHKTSEPIGFQKYFMINQHKLMFSKQFGFWFWNVSNIWTRGSMGIKPRFFRSKEVILGPGEGFYIYQYDKKPAGWYKWESNGNIVQGPIQSISRNVRVLFFSPLIVIFIGEGWRLIVK